MGAWGYGLLEDDVAADLAAVWDEYVARGLGHDPEHWTPERVFDFFRRVYFASRPFDLNDGDTAVAVLALGALFLENGVAMPEALKDLLAQAAGVELRPGTLRDFASPRKRRRVLEDFLRAIGREPVDVPAPRYAVEDEIRQWEEFAKHYPRWVELARKPFNDERFFALCPPWFFALQDVLGQGTRHPDEAVTQRAARHRLTFLAFFTGMLMKLPDEERMAMVRAAGRVEGKIWILPG